MSIVFRHKDFETITLCSRNEGSAKKNKLHTHSAFPETIPWGGIVSFPGKLFHFALQIRLFMIYSVLA